MLACYIQAYSASRIFPTQFEQVPRRSDGQGNKTCHLELSCSPICGILACEINSPKRASPPRSCETSLQLPISCLSCRILSPCFCFFNKSSWLSPDEYNGLSLKIAKHDPLAEETRQSSVISFCGICALQCFCPVDGGSGSPDFVLIPGNEVSF